MARVGKLCAHTADLLDWQPPEIVQPVPDADIRAGTLRGRLARMLAVVMKDSDKTRENLAIEMAEFLGEEMSAHTLNQCASQAREDHTLSAIRCAALASVTGDVRMFQVLLTPLGYAVVPERYLPAIEAEIQSERADTLDAQAEKLRQNAAKARRQWKGLRS